MSCDTTSNVFFFMTYLSAWKDPTIKMVCHLLNFTNKISFVHTDVLPRNSVLGILKTSILYLKFM